jgi:hypothetical protein
MTKRENQRQQITATPIWELKTMGFGDSKETDTELTGSIIERNHSKDREGHPGRSKNNQKKETYETLTEQYCGLY